MSNGLRTILSAGILAGIMDISYAFLQWWAKGIMPVRILHSIASGLLGKAAFQGGYNTAALGLLLHFFIAISAAAVYYAASLKIPFLTRRPIPSGILYGWIVYFFMQLVVIPMAGLKPSVNNSELLLHGLAAHALCVGLPIAWVTS